MLAIDRTGQERIASSTPVLIDITSPNQGWITVGHGKTLQYVSSVDIRWGGFYDDESGIKSFHVGIGSTPYSSDIKHMFRSDGLFVSIGKTSSLVEGHVYYAVIKVNV